MPRERKRPAGRPPRTDSPERLVLKVPGELKRWLMHRAIDEKRNVTALVTEALVAYRQRAVRGQR